MISVSHASISLRALLATVAMVGVATFVVARQSQPPFVISPLTLCSTTTQAAFPDETPYLTENDAAINKMMSDMVIKPTGDVDRDFVAMMTPHHQGAIEMAQAVLRSGRNEQIRRLAQEVIVTQQQEIAAMRMAIGDPLPPSAPSPTQISATPTSRVPSILTSFSKTGELQ
ncbi:MAG TPA: DUF305 domain-containing protein [Bradyrhizobium sp.]